VYSSQIDWGGSDLKKFVMQSSDMEARLGGTSSRGEKGGGRESRQLLLITWPRTCSFWKRLWED